MRGTKAIIGLACGLFAACGKDHTLTDAGGADANTTDAGNTIDADSRGTVTVTVLNTDGVSGPEPGVMVAFIEADGTTVTKEVATDASGKASADVLPGASVTAVYALAQTQHRIETIMGVKPGDDLTIGTMHPDTTAAGTFTVNVVAVVGSTEYAVYGPCGYSSFLVPPPSLRAHPLGVVATIPIDLPMTNDCVQPTMDLVAVRYDDTGGTTYVELPGTAFTAGGNVTQQTAWQPIASLVASYTNAPADVDQIYVDALVPDELGYEWSSYVSPTSGSASATMSVPLAARALIKTNYGGQHNGSQWVYEITDGTKTTYGVDIGASLMPWIEIPTMDFATGKITTANTGSGGPGDAFQITYSFSRTDPNSIGGSAMIDVYDWTVWAPTLADITLPRLPTDLADNDPAAGDTDGGGTARLGDLDLATGYDAVRAHLDAAYEPYRDTGRGALGKLRLSTSESLPSSFTRRFHAGAPRR